MRAESLLGAGEALVHGFFGLGFVLAESEGAGGGDLLVVSDALGFIEESFVGDSQARH